MDNTPTSSPGHGASRRRLLLRGALAAPALMTVCTGASAATASNLRCLTNANNMPAPAAVGITGSTGDSYMRVRLWKVTLCDPNASPACTPEDRFYVRGSDLQLLTSTGSGVPGTGQYLQINPVSFQRIGGPVDPPAFNLVTSQEPSNIWVAARFDSSGALVGFGADTQGAMVGASCWNSVLSYVAP